MVSNCSYLYIIGKIIVRDCSVKAACINIGMPGENCAFPQCHISRNKNYEGIGLFKLPGYPGTFYDEWRKKLLAVLFKYISILHIFRCGVHTHPHSPVYPMFPSGAFIFIF